ncbi:MAG: hypothetical protein NVSMB1_06460 [Polyangiales bacterium]
MWQRLLVIVSSAAATVAVAVFASCTFLDEIARFPNNDADADTAVDATDTSDTMGGLTCPQIEGGPYMVQVADFCIDATEVTKRQFKRWRDTNPDVKKQELFCQGNKSSEALQPKARPPGDPSYCSPSAIDPTVQPDGPVVCVNWCDASTFCRAHGKRLCGKIGAAAGSEGPPPDDASKALNNATVSQWFAACVGDPPTIFPYGNALDKSLCNGLDYQGNRDAALAAIDSNLTVPVASATGCHGKGPPPYGAIFDMSGNVAEWTDNCTLPVDDPLFSSCLARGGCFLTGEPAELACEATPLTITKQRSWFDNHIGFRCCYP